MCLFGNGGARTARERWVWEGGTQEVGWVIEVRNKDGRAEAAAERGFRKNFGKEEGAAVRAAAAYGKGGVEGARGRVLGADSQQPSGACHYPPPGGGTNS